MSTSSFTRRSGRRLRRASGAAKWWSSELSRPTAKKTLSSWAGGRSRRGDGPCGPGRMLTARGRTVKSNGRVGGVSARTGPGGKKGYQAGKRGCRSWGTGALLPLGRERRRSVIPRATTGGTRWLVGKTCAGLRGEIMVERWDGRKMIHSVLGSSCLPIFLPTHLSTVTTLGTRRVEERLSRKTR